MGQDFRFGVRDLIAIREGAVQSFKALPSRCRLSGMKTDLSEEDKQVIAWTGAVLMQLNRVGVTPPELTKNFFPEPYTGFHLDQEPSHRPGGCICDPLSFQNDHIRVVLCELDATGELIESETLLDPRATVN